MSGLWQHPAAVGEARRQRGGGVRDGRWLQGWAVALVLGLGQGVQQRELLVDLTFGVTFISLVVQGLPLGKALEWLGLVERDPMGAELERHQAPGGGEGGPGGAGAAPGERAGVQAPV